MLPVIVRHFSPNVIQFGVFVSMSTILRNKSIPELGLHFPSNGKHSQLSVISRDTGHDRKHLNKSDIAWQFDIYCRANKPEMSNYHDLWITIVIHTIVLQLFKIYNEFLETIQNEARLSFVQPLSTSLYFQYTMTTNVRLY